MPFWKKFWALLAFIEHSCRKFMGEIRSRIQFNKCKDSSAKSKEQQEVLSTFANKQVIIIL